MTMPLREAEPFIPTNDVVTVTASQKSSDNSENMVIQKLPTKATDGYKTERNVKTESLAK